MIYYKNASELYHHGILGQKWGVRRYQNKDGTLTPEGRKHLSENAGSYLNPKYKDKHSKNRKQISNEYEAEYNKYLDKYAPGFDGDGTEAHVDVGIKSGDPVWDTKIWNSFISKYADATLTDLGYKITPETRKFVEGLFDKDLLYIYDFYKDGKYRDTEGLDREDTEYYLDWGYELKNKRLT